MAPAPASQVEPPIDIFGFIDFQTELEEYLDDIADRAYHASGRW